MSGNIIAFPLASDVDATLPETLVTATRLPSDQPTGQPSTQQNLWLRTWNLTLGQSGAGITTPSGQSAIGVGSDTSSLTQGGTTLDLSEFHFTFEVTQAVGGAPWKLLATVFNVPLELAQKISDQFTTVALTAGYSLPQPVQENKTATMSQDSSGLPVGERSDAQAAALTIPQGYKSGGSLLFSGSVIWYEKGRETNITDTFLKIYANSFDEARNQSMINTTLKAGHTAKDAVKACADAMNLVPGMSGVAVTMGILVDGIDTSKAARGRTLYGNPDDVLRDIAQSFGCHYNIDDAGKINIVKADGSSSQAATTTSTIVVNSDTGMIGIPHLNMDGGVSVRTLLNPAIRPNTKIQINQGDITQKQLSQSSTGEAGTAPAGIPSEVKQVQQASTFLKQCDGTFNVWAVQHTGDTRGNPWYSDITTQAAVAQPTKLG